MNKKTSEKVMGFKGFGGELNAGLVLGYTGLIYVVARVDSGKTPEILAWGKEPYGHGVTRKSPEFPEILEKTLKKCLGSYKKAKIWCTIQSKGVETRFLVVPDAPRKHLPKTVFWAFKKEAAIGDEPLVFDFDVLGSRETKGRKELEILACSAPVSDLEDIKSVFKLAGRPLTGITVTSFAFQNLFRTGYSGEGSRHIGTLFIGTDWSRIDIFSEGNLILSRDIKTGTRSMDEVLLEPAVREIKQQEAVIDMDRYLSDQEKEPAGDSPSDVPAVETPSLNEKSFGMIEMLEKGTAQDREASFGRIIPVVNRLIRQIERTFEHFSMTTGGRKVERIYFTGPLCSYRRLLKFTGDQLGIPVHTINPFPLEEQDNPSRFDEFVPAAGLALSHNDHTLNFIFTYKDRENSRKNKKMTAILCLLIAVTLVAGIVFHRVSIKRDKRQAAAISLMTADLAQRESLYGKEKIQVLADRLSESKKQLEKLKKNAMGVAVFTDICRVTRGNIRLTSFLFEQAQEGPKTARVELRGVVLVSQPEQAKSEHEAYVENLKKLNGVSQVTVTHSAQASLAGQGEQQVLYFEMDLTINDTSRP